ncbi:MAG: HAD hydrolase family protein [Oscillospiraceae bacterium]
MRETKKLPAIGKRIIKSAVGVFLCYSVYLLRGKQGIPFYSMLAVLWCIQPYTGKMRTMALQRTVGTLTGALFGFIAILVEIYVFSIYDTLAGYVFTALMIIPVIYTTLILHKQNASYFSCVVFLSITVMHITDSNPYIFVLNRILDTFIGIGLGIAINSFRLPRRKECDTLFVAELDDMISPVRDEILPYSKVEMNRMLDDGLKMTIATMRTPASLMKPMEDVRLNIPVIVMDGAALYDIKENSYVQAYVISRQTADRVRKMLSDSGLNCFVNALCDDTLAIFYDRLDNHAEKSIYSQLKRSPYRNYIRREPSEQDKVIYLMTIDETQKIRSFYDRLKSTELGESLKILCYPSDDYKGFSYIKIYNKNACRENMIEYVERYVGLDRAVTIGCRSENNIRLSGGDLNSIVRALKNAFEPFVWKNKRN